MIRWAWMPACVLLGCLSAAAQEAPERLRVGGDAAYPPFEWLAADGEVRGFNVELMRLLAEPGGTELEFELGSWPETLDKLDAGRLDIVPMFVSEQRRQRYRFTNVYYYQTHALFGRPSAAPLDDLDSLGGTDFVVEARSFAAGRLQGDARPPGLLFSDNTREALRMVADGEVEYALLAAPVAAELIRRNDWELERKSPPFWPRGYAFAVRSDHEELAAWAQSRLVEVMSNGAYLGLYREWSDRLEPGAGYDAGYVRTILWALAILVVALLAVGLWTWSLRRQVAERTRTLDRELGQRKRAEKQARELARRDPITELSNIRHFCGRCERFLEDGDGEVMLIRLLELESVVRTFGYRIAERMIIGFSRALQTTFDPPVAHLGRGTFAVFDASGKAHERLDDLQRAVRKGDAPVYPRFVTGSAFHSDGGEDINALLQKAELALAESETRHHRWTRYGTHLQSDPLDLEVIDSARAGRLDGLGFVCQPQVRLGDRRIVACELLARWEHPSLGSIEPDRFVPLLENAGLIGELTDLALDCALDLSERLRNAGVDVAVSVNVSARDLLNPDFGERVSGTIAARSVSPGALKFEITETSLVGDPESVRATLDRIAAAGVTVALDDFGKGYSSLDYISRFPIREVKIDRQFVARMADSERDRSIVRSTIAMAHEMGMTVVGEGAETDAHVDLLAGMDCDLAQGWAIGMPAPADELLDSLQRGDARTAAAADPENRT
ncbi:MAG: EAL domain-containing protein [Candidatus Wenzhouxiangella sp. M2_3B_020]